MQQYYNEHRYEPPARLRLPCRVVSLDELDCPVIPFDADLQVYRGIAVNRLKNINLTNSGTWWTASKAYAEGYAQSKKSTQIGILLSAVVSGEESYTHKHIQSLWRIKSPDFVGIIMPCDQEMVLLSSSLRDVKIERIYRPTPLPYLSFFSTNLQNNLGE